MTKWRYLNDEEKVSLLKKYIQGRVLRRVSLEQTSGYSLLVLDFGNGIKLKITDGEYGDLRCVDIIQNNKKIVMLLDDEEHPCQLTTFEEVHNNPKILYVPY